MKEYTQKSIAGLKLSTVYDRKRVKGVKIKKIQLYFYAPCDLMLFVCSLVALNGVKVSVSLAEVESGDLDRYELVGLATHTPC